MHESQILQNFTENRLLQFGYDKEAIAKLPAPAKSPFWRPLPPFRLAYSLEYGLVRMARASMLALTRNTKIITFSDVGSFAIASKVIAKGLPIGSGKIEKS